jgi:hypothetical protein
MCAGAGGRGCCTRREAGTFSFFGASLSEAAAVVGCLGAVAFLLASGVVGLTCAAAVLACRFWLPSSAPALGFGACGGAPTVATAAAPLVGGIE